ncbi:2-oxoglutarate and iron-dependent oxygenase domain-containing protein [Klebsiella pneumoniae]
MNATTLPILDLARYADPADKAAFLADLRHAARDIGFFYLITTVSTTRFNMKFSASPSAFLLSMRRKNSRWR